MSENPKPDLEQVKSEFESFRAGRSGKERLPENLWAAAVELLEHYPFNVVWRELRLKAEYLRYRAEAAKGKGPHPVEKKKKFLELRGSELTAINNSASKNVAALSPTAECRLVIERCDGSRLTLNLPVDWSRIETMCASFLRA